MSKRKESPDFVKCELAHIGYTVHFRDMKYLHSDVLDQGGAAYTLTIDKNSSYVFLRDIAKFVKQPHNLPLAAHEIVHVLQNICRDRMMNFEEEKEHMAYTMSYLLNELYGYSYNIEKAP